MGPAEENRAELLEKIRENVINFTDSPLYEYRRSNNYLPVIGEGNHEAKIVFIGEAPGKNEALTGKPFCGTAGKLLDELFASAKIDRSSVYITNILKDRPPNNRDPEPAEIELYVPFLDRQLEVIKPKTIVTLGRFAMDYIMKKYGLEDNLQPIGKLHGSKFDVDAPFGPLRIIPFYHPAAALYSTTTKEELKKDFQILKNLG
jgi:uracil-DNA glycosylase